MRTDPRYHGTFARSVVETLHMLSDEFTWREWVPVFGRRSGRRSWNRFVARLRSHDVPRSERLLEDGRLALELGPRSRAWAEDLLPPLTDEAAA